jgi:phosphatidate cytidylyltransferase
MLKTRVISAVLGLALLFAAVMISVETLAIAVFILSVAAIYEFNNAVSNAGCKPIKWVGYISCGLILAIGTINGSISIVYNPMGNLIKLFRTAEDILLFMFFILLLLFIQQIFSYPKYNIADISGLLSCFCTSILLGFRRCVYYIYLTTPTSFTAFSSVPS